jgi:hypothetical protein
VLKAILAKEEYKVLLVHLDSKISRQELLLASWSQFMECPQKQEFFSGFKLQQILAITKLFADFRR